MKIKSIRWANKPSDIPTMTKALACGQKSFFCIICNEYGPWWERTEHKCKGGN